MAASGCQSRSRRQRSCRIPVRRTRPAGERGEEARRPGERCSKGATPTRPTSGWSWSLPLQSSAPGRAANWRRLGLAPSSNRSDRATASNLPCAATETPDLRRRSGCQPQGRGRGRNARVRSPTSAAPGTRTRRPAPRSRRLTAGWCAYSRDCGGNVGPDAPSPSVAAVLAGTSPASNLFGDDGHVERSDRGLWRRVHLRDRSRRPHALEP